MGDHVMSWQNVLDGNALSVSLVGMSIVFCGLIFISVYIFALPFVLRWLEHHGFMKPGSSPLSPKLTKEELAAVAFVLDAEKQRGKGAMMRVTIPIAGAERSPWSLSNKMRTFPVRNPNK